MMSGGQRALIALLRKIVPLACDISQARISRQTTRDAACIARGKGYASPFTRCSPLGA